MNYKKGGMLNSKTSFIFLKLKFIFSKRSFKSGIDLRIKNQRKQENGANVPERYASRQPNG